MVRTSDLIGLAALALGVFAFLRQKDAQAIEESEKFKTSEQQKAELKAVEDARLSQKAVLDDFIARISTPITGRTVFAEETNALATKQLQGKIPPGAAGPVSKAPEIITRDEAIRREIPFNEILQGRVVLSDVPGAAAGSFTNLGLPITPDLPSGFTTRGERFIPPPPEDCQPISTERGVVCEEEAGFVKLGREIQQGKQSFLFQAEPEKQAAAASPGFVGLASQTALPQSFLSDFP